MNKNNTWENERNQAQRLLRKQIGRLEKQLCLCREELAKALKWPGNYHEAVLLQSHLYLVKPGMTSIAIPDWEQEGKTKTIGLEPRVAIPEQLKKRFKQAKKLERSIPYLEKRLDMLESNLQNLTQRFQEMEKIDSEESWNTLQSGQAPPVSHKKSIQKPVRLPYKIYHSPSGIEIWVGRTAKDNETLSLKCARGNDWWAHTAAVPGSHIVIRSDTPDEETLRYAMELAITHSRLKNAGEGEVILTQCKFVSKGPGGHKPGTVSVSKHKRYKIVIRK